MNAHEIALAAHTRAESAAQGRDAYRAKTKADVVASLFAGETVSTGFQESLTPLDVVTAVSEACPANLKGFVQSIGAIRALLNTRHSVERDTAIYAECCRVVSVVELCVGFMVDDRLDEIEEDEKRTAAMEAAYDRAERAQ